MILVVAATEAELAGAAGADSLVCGIGPVEAAAATARALAERRPDAVLNVGLAGATGIDPPTVVIGSEARYCDISGDVAAAMPRVERVHSDARLVEAARTALPEALVLPIGTTAFVGRGFDCEVEAMEGFAVLRAAALAGVPAVEVRAIANAVDETDRTRWRFDDALAALAEAVPRLLAELG
jgi:nucleoside phosphorylase